MPAEFIYTTYKLGRHYPPDRTVLEDISISFYPGAKIGVIGSNGAGKSSLLRIMAGLDDGFVGDARLTPGFTVGYLAQEPQLDPAKDVKGNVLDGVGPIRDLIDQYNAVMAKWSEPDADYEAIGAEQSAIEDRINAVGAWDVERNVEIAMDALRCPPDDADVATLSGGEKRRVALARLLLQHPDLLLLDEPTNHLDAESVEWLERFLQEYAGTVVAITHDRYFLDNVAQWILELDRGRGIPFSGNYTGWLEQKLARMAGEQKTADAKARTLARELEWVRLSPRARQAKGKARLTAYEQLMDEASNDKGAARELEIVVPPGPRLGDQVIEVEHLRKGYGDRLLIEDLSFTLPRSGIVGIIGPNGAGKTTLFRMLVGQEGPDAGTITIGDTVAMSYVDQSRDSLDASKNVFQEITQGVEFVKSGSREIPARARSRLGRTSRRSTFAAPTSRSSSGSCPAASATASTWPSCCSPTATSCCSTSRPTTSTSIRSGRSRRVSSPSRAAPSSSATIAGSWTGSPRTSSPSKATARSCGSKATSRCTKCSATSGSAPMPTSPTV